ncbi:MAG TPA: glycosyltransferase family 2 protein [Solirubrobacteraceae bacterium]|nr:glycosyltransferase family 2 protein [Solirubrobacteraceae bacterium]
MSPATDTSEPDAAVVVVNYRAAALTERCLASVHADGGELTLEEVIVDNGSGDGSVERLRAALPAARVIALPDNRGFAAGVNAAFAHTSAAVVLLLNPDTEVRPGALVALFERLREHPRSGVLAPLLEGPDGRLAPNAYRRFPTLFAVTIALCVPILYALEHAPALHPDAFSPAALDAGRRPAWVSGAAMAVRRTAYDQAGPLDEGFFLYFEEAEWQSRVARAGWDIEIVPHARVRHLMRGGGKEALVPSPHYLASALRYLRLGGVSELVARPLFALSLASSWLTLRLIALLPAKRVRARWQASAYASLLREVL